jgi:hypothetical protein
MSLVESVPVSLCFLLSAVVTAGVSSSWSESEALMVGRTDLAAEGTPHAGEQEDARLEVPASGEIKKARLLLKDDYRAEYRKNGREDLLALANEFLELSADEEWRPRRRYALQEEALALAVKAGAMDVAWTAALRMGETFQVDSLVLRFDALKSMHKQHRTGACGLNTLGYSLHLAQSSRLERNFTLADRSFARAQACAKSIDDEYLGDRLKELRKRLAWEKGHWSKALRATTSAARTRFEFLIEGVRPGAGSLLQPGEEDQVPREMVLDEQLAQHENAMPESAGAQFELATLWSLRAEKGDFVDTLPFRRRAVTWSLKALEKLPKGLDRRALEKELLDFYRASHDPVAGVPVDPWEFTSRLSTEDRALARSLFWHDFSILTERRWTFSKHRVRLHNLSAQAVPGERLRGRLSWLCRDDSGATSVLKRELGYSSRSSSLLHTIENEGEFVAWGAGGNMTNAEIEKANGGDWIPENAHLLVTLDGVPVFESFWKEPTSLWWLD